MPDQFLVGVDSIPSAEYFPVSDSNIIQTLVTGETSIATGESFPEQTGVYIDPLSVPSSINIAY